MQAIPSPPVDVYVEEARLLETRLASDHPAMRDPGRLGALHHAVAGYIRQAPRLSADGRRLAVARIAAQIGDAHTASPLLPLPGQDTPRPALFPVRLEQFDDGVFVLGVAAAHAAVLGRRVDAVAGRPVEAALAEARRYLPSQTPGFAAEYAPEWLMVQPLAAAAGLTDAGGALALGLDGGVVETIRPQPFALFDWLFSRTAGPDPDWRISPGPADLASGPRGYTVIDGRTLYIRIDEIRDPDGAWGALIENAFSALPDRPDAQVVIDLRGCIGGDGTLNAGLVDRLRADPRFSDGRGVHVLIGRRTHSAGIMLVSALQRLPQVRTAGQPTGDAPSHYGETQVLTLPATGATVLYASAYYETAGPGDRRPSITPDLLVPFLHADYARGRDAVIDAVMKQIEDDQ